MSIFELQQERNKQLSQPKIKEAEQAYKPISETYNIVDYYNTMRNGKYEQMTQSKAKIPNQQLSYFSEHLKSSELMKTGKHNLNLHSLLSERANQLKGYNKPQVYEEKLSSGSDSKVVSELESLLNNFTEKIQSGVFDISMSNDIYAIFKIFERSSYLFSRELLEKYRSYVDDIITVVEDEDTKELIKRDFKGSNIRQLLDNILTRTKDLIEIMLEQELQGKNQTEKQIVLQNALKNASLKKIDKTYIQMVNAEYKKTDKNLEKAKKERNQTLITALTTKLDELKRARTMATEPEMITPVPMGTFDEPDEFAESPADIEFRTARRLEEPSPEIPTAAAAPVVAMDSTASSSMPPSSTVPESSSKRPKLSEEEANREAGRLSALLAENDRITADYNNVLDSIEEFGGIYRQNDERISALGVENRQIVSDRRKITNKKVEKRTPEQITELTELNRQESQNRAEINRLTAQNTNLENEIDRLLQVRDDLRPRVMGLEREIELMTSVVDELSQVASNPAIDIPANVAELLTPARTAEPAIPEDDLGGVPEAKDEAEEDEEYPFNQDYNDVVKNTTKIKVTRYYVKYNKENYPRTRTDFINKFDDKKQPVYDLLYALGINSKSSGMPRSKLLTVQAMYDRFLSSNPNLMTASKPSQYWFQ
jgi:hypothetical protein